MKWTVRAEHLFYAGFALILLRQPLRYIIGPAFMVASIVGMFLYFGSLLFNAKGLKLGKKDRIFVVFFLSISVLHILLMLAGDRGIHLRPLWFSGLAQFLTIILFLHYRRSPDAWKFFKFIFTTAIVIECSLAFLQVSYYSTGIGLPPVFDEYEEFSFVSGSFFNANDFSVFVSSCAMALYSCWMIEGKNNRSYLVIGLALMAVFVSLSRTAFVIMMFFVFAVLLQSGKKMILTPKKKSSIITLVMLILMFITVAYLLSTSFLADSSVFERSIERISQVGEIATDKSSSLRSLVYFRLWENIPNLWFGTFSDLNYSFFFKSGDDALMQVNPHSFVVEMSFLYGWLGFATAFGLVGFIVIGIMSNRDLPFFMRCVTAGSLILFQSVPSSILANTNFFLPYLLLMYCRKSLLDTNNIQKN